MKRFVILGHKTPLTSDFHLNDLPGAAGRIDVLCRAIGASLFLSHGMRRDVEVNLLLQDRVRIRIPGDRVKRLNPDERSTAALIKHALKALEEGKRQGTPGIYVSEENLGGLLGILETETATPIVLHETGIPVDSYVFPEHPAFILSDHMDFTVDEEMALAGYDRISLGKNILHTSQAITIAHYVMDQREEDREAELVLAHTIWDETQAQMIKSLLEDFEIPSNLMMQAPPSLYPMAVDGMAEVRIMVRPRDLERAHRIITDYFDSPTEL